MKRFLCFMLGSMILQSCVITNTPGFYSGYSQLSENEKSKIVFTDPQREICNINTDGKIYSVTGIQLHECISSSQKAIVYFWSPNCSSEKCYNYNFINEYCQDNGYALFFIVEYYDFKKTNAELLSSALSAIYSVNERYYKTKYCNKYMRLFIKDMLVNQDCIKDVFYSNVFVFHDGKLARTTLE